MSKKSILSLPCSPCPNGAIIKGVVGEPSMEGSKVNLENVLEVAKRLVADFSEHLVAISAALCILIFFLLVLCWYITKRRFNRPGHQVPGGVIKDYLDSLIQNSTALRSSLFRDQNLNSGGPSVISSYKKPSKEEEKMAPKTGTPTEVLALKNQLSQQEKLIGELEKKLKSAPTSPSHEPGKENSKDVSVQRLNDEISKLQQQLKAITEERDELKEKLKEYEVIEHDLADLKKLQKENTRLKGDLGKKEKVEVPGTPVTEEKSPEEKPNPPHRSNEEKSAEDLLDEFEKMLG